MVRRTTIGMVHPADLTGSNAGQAGEHNRALVLRAIHRDAPISRAELARHCGLTKQTIARIADRLLDEGLIMEARRRRGLRGQPAIELEIDPEGCFSIGVDIDRDHLTIVAVDATNAIRGRVHHEERFILPNEAMAMVGDAISYFRRSHLIDEARVSGIGVAIPDWLGELPVLGRPDNYGQWTGFDVREAAQAAARREERPFTASFRLPEGRRGSTVPFGSRGSNARDRGLRSIVPRSRWTRRSIPISKGWTARRASSPERSPRRGRARTA